MGKRCKKIMIIEGQPLLAMNYRAILSSFGLECDKYATFDQALDALGSGYCPDVAIVDLDMVKGLSVVEFTKIIKDRIPVVYSSSMPEDMINEKTHHASVYGYLPKEASGERILLTLNMAYSLFLAHQESRKNKRTYEVLFEKASVPMILVSETGEILHANDIFLSSCPVSSAKNIFEIVASEERKNLKAVWKKNPANLDVLNYLIAEHSSKKSLVDIKTIVRIDDNWILQCVFTLLGNDKTRTVSRKEWSGLFNAISQMAMIVDEEHNILDVNLNVIRQTGESYEEILKKKCYEVFHSTAIAPQTCPLENCLTTGTSEKMNLMEIEAFGTTCLVSCGLIEDEKGTKKFVHLATDISELKEKQRLIDEQKMKYQTLIDNSQDQIVQIDTELICRFASPLVAQIWGSSFSTIAGKKITRFLPEARKSEIENKLLNCIKSGENFQVEQEFFYEGKQTVYSWKFSPLVMNDMSVAGILAVGRDITEVKQKEWELAHALEEKNTLFLELQHRVKNNMLMIVSLLSLEEENLVSEIDKNIFKEAEGRIRVMMILYERLYRTNEVQHVGLREYLLDLVNLIEQNYFSRAQKVSCSVEVADMRLDAKKSISIGFILNELMTNSAKYNAENEKLVINIRFSEQDSVYVFEYSDNGSGYEDEMLSGRKTGFGTELIGLQVEEMHGSVDFYNDNGACVKICVPKKSDPG